MRKEPLFILITFMFSILGCSNKPLDTVQKVDIKKYMGKWYEIASFPQSFQKGCTCTTAEYELMPNGFVKVTNSCKTSEEQKVSIGKAWVTDKNSNAKLKVQFFWPFSGKYWIIDLADDYSYAVVGHPNRKYLWILSRAPKMDKTIYNKIVARTKTKGFDIDLLNITDQTCN